MEVIKKNGNMYWFYTLKPISIYEHSKKQRERECIKKKSKGLKKKRKEKRLLMLKTGSGKNIEFS